MPFIGTSTAAQTTVQIVINGADATENLTPYLIEVRYDDELGNKADNLEIELADPQRLFIGEWSIDRGDKMSVTVTQLNWGYAGEKIVSHFGSFQVDEIEFRFGKHQGCVTTIRATSIPVSGTMKLEAHDDHWEKSDLKSIAQKVCGKSGVTLSYLAATNPTYDVKDQVQESDISFLTKLCKREGMFIKMTNNQMVIQSEATAEKASPVATFVYGHGIIEGELRLSSADTYSGATVSGSNPLTGNNTESDYKPEGGSPSGASMNINEYQNFNSTDSPIGDGIV